MSFEANQINMSSLSDKLIEPKHGSQALTCFNPNIVSNLEHERAFQQTCYGIRNKNTFDSKLSVKKLKSVIQFYPISSPTSY